MAAQLTLRPPTAVVDLAPTCGAAGSAPCSRPGLGRPLCGAHLASSATSSRTNVCPQRSPQASDAGPRWWISVSLFCKAEEKTPQILGGHPWISVFDLHPLLLLFAQVTAGGHLLCLDPSCCPDVSHCRHTIVSPGRVGSARTLRPSWEKNRAPQRPRETSRPPGFLEVQRVWGRAPWQVARCSGQPGLGSGPWTAVPGQHCGQAAGNQASRWRHPTHRQAPSHLQGVPGCWVRLLRPQEPDRAVGPH